MKLFLEEAEKYSAGQDGGGIQELSDLKVAC